jgi:hypothetical protein
MLYNPSWDNPLQSSLQDLISWLETQPANQEYTYFDSQNCLLCQFLKSKGISNPVINKEYWHERSGSTPVPLPPHFNTVAEGSLFSRISNRWTCGAALKRAKSFL